MSRGASNTEIVAGICCCCVPHQVPAVRRGEDSKNSIQYLGAIDEPDEAHHKRITSNDSAAGDTAVSITFPRFGEEPRLARKDAGHTPCSSDRQGDHYEFEN